MHAHITHHRGFRRLAAMVLGWSLAIPSAVPACPLCKDALSGDPIGSALSWTTLLLIAFPSGLVTLIGGWIFFMYWRAARQAASATLESPSPAWSAALNEKESET